jgi:hypothetical protein
MEYKILQLNLAIAFILAIFIFLQVPIIKTLPYSDAQYIELGYHMKIMKLYINSRAAGLIACALFLLNNFIFLHLARKNKNL